MSTENLATVAKNLGVTDLVKTEVPLFVKHMFKDMILFLIILSLKKQGISSREWNAAVDTIGRYWSSQRIERKFSQKKKNLWRRL